MKRKTIVKGMVYDFKISLDRPNRIAVEFNLILNAKEGNKSMECAKKIMELRDQFKEIKITVEEIK